MFSIILGALPAILRLIGLAETAEALIERIEARKKAQVIADTPTTKKEISDAADKGQL